MATRLKSGIYAIVNTDNGDRYVGSSATLRKRRAAHLSKLRRNVHGNPHLQAAWNKYGEACFEFVVLEYVDAKLLLDVEQTYLNTTRTEYNIATVAWAPQLGKPLSAETRAKQSAALKGRPVPAERRARTSATLMGHAVPKETRAKISRVKKGKPTGPRSFPRTQEHCAKLSAAGKNRRHSEATKAKMRAARMGHSVSEETRAKLSASHKGRHLSGETKAKISANRKGIPVSDETRAKLSAAMKNVWANRRKQKEPA